MIDKIVQFYRIDKTGEGESNKLIIVYRTMESAVVVYAILCAVYFAYWHSAYTCALFSIVAVMYACTFLMSYKASTRAQIIVVNLLSLISVTCSFIIFGTGTLVRNFFIPLVVLCFFSGYGYYKIKCVYSAFVCGIYVILQYYIDDIVPRVVLSDGNHHFLQMMNILFPFFLVGIVCYVYGTDSQQLEGKLLEYNEALKKQAATDPLTGLCNRRSGMEFIDELIKVRSENGFCVCMCDIDFFKKVNDSYGHDIGDNVLRGVAKTMLEGFPKNCRISRWGGEEFLIIFPNMNGDNAKMILDVMQSRIKKLVFDVGADKHFSITATYGLAEYGYDGDADSLVKEADRKLYYGKEHGRDQVVF